MEALFKVEIFCVVADDTTKKLNLIGYTVTSFGANFYMVSKHLKKAYEIMFTYLLSNKYVPRIWISQLVDLKKIPW